MEWGGRLCPHRPNMRSERPRDSSLRTMVPPLAQAASCSSCHQVRPDCLTKMVPYKLGTGEITTLNEDSF
jgi:hypothetical protein